MSDSDADIETDISASKDRGEALSMMEPLLISEGSRNREALIDLAVELAARSAGFRRSLPEGVLTALADLVCVMNCYYSNLIEGHDTHPVDIERALKGDYRADTEKRDLQLEAKAHIAVRQWIDEGGLRNHAVTSDGICEIHRRFYERLPDDLLWIEEPDTDERIRVVPGELRQRDVKVGQHVPISPGALHRTLDTGGIWSIARGLARNSRACKSHLAACDLPRRNDLDGRGNLSEEGLASFTRFFLETCLDQVKFMEELVQPERLRSRILLWTEEEVRAGVLPAKAGSILEAILYRDKLPRGEIAGILGASDRHARRVVASLSEHGVITSESTRAPLRLTFPAKLATRWMPGLFPEKLD